MHIKLSDVGKKYHRNYILKNVNLTIKSGAVLGVTGPNGSGKSTLLKLISSILTPTDGTITYLNANNVELTLETVPHLISFAAPYIDLPGQLSIAETVDFHSKHRVFKEGLTTEKIIEIALLSDATNRQIDDLSSGMLQRLKLTLALCSEGSLILLDEPTTNLDVNGKKWYNKLMNNYLDGNTCIIASNEEADFLHCQEQISVLDFKREL